MSELIRVIIVDDEPLARQYLRNLLAEDKQMAIVDECANGKSAVTAIRKHKPDVVFLDIQMPGLDGFGVIDAVGAAEMPLVVFVTAYDKYAIRAFEAHAAEYLLKPFDTNRFNRMLQHVKTQLASRHPQSGLVERLERLLREFAASKAPRSGTDRTELPSHLTRIPVKTGSGTVLVRAEEIDWVEAADSYIVIHCGAKRHLLRETMNWAERNLDPKLFFRLHRTAIVNLNRIKELKAAWRGDFCVILQDGTKVPLSRRRRKDLERVIGRTI